MGATDPDYNTLLVTFYTLPNKGKLYVDNTASVAIKTGIAYDLPNVFGAPTVYYVPDGVFNGTVTFSYDVNDGCITSVSKVRNQFFILFYDVHFFKHEFRAMETKQ